MARVEPSPSESYRWPTFNRGEDVMGNSKDDRNGNNNGIDACNETNNENDNDSNHENENINNDNKWGDYGYILMIYECSSEQFLLDGSFLLMKLLYSTLNWFHYNHLHCLMSSEVSHKNYMSADQ